jgi:hypothetical protein
MIDGGTEYTRRSLNKEQAHPIVVYSDDPHEFIRDYFAWGTYGKAGDEPLHYKLLKDMTDHHIMAILGMRIPSHFREIFNNELSWRRNNAFRI